jgi:KUP system potassium uptake protein
MSQEDAHSGHKSTLAGLMVGASGVVFGDIGTSPLYALQATFDEAHKLAPNLTNLYGVTSLIFWTLISVVTLKYVFIIMRAANHGEGGSLALLALIKRKLRGKTRTAWLVVLGLFATALFYGDSMITPAVSVLSAVEGLDVVSKAAHPYIVWIGLTILLGLFAIQSHGTEVVGKLFGPVMLVYFAVIAAMGLANIWGHWHVFMALNPMNIPIYFMAHPFASFISLGAVIYAATGAEALYADMGHFGRKPIMLAWLYMVFPALILNYLGQAALLEQHPQFTDNPFFHMVPNNNWVLIPLVLLATLATVIASQAVISGAYSVTQQAIQLGFLPRMKIEHTSSHAEGQIYVPAVNWFLAIMVALLVIVYRSSEHLLPAYGLAVVGTMIITTLMMAVMIFRVWKINIVLGAVALVTFLAIDGLYLASGLVKIPEGAWLPLLVGVIIFTLLTTWDKGRCLVKARLEEGALPIETFIASATKSAHRVKGTAVYLTSSADGVPPALLHNLKHNKVLHERIILLTVKIRNVPMVMAEEQMHALDLGNGFHRLILKFGFMQETNIPAALASLEGVGSVHMMDTSFFLARQTLLPSERPGMAIWREHLFAWMLRSADSAMSFFKLPTNRVIELGSQVEI